MATPMGEDKLKCVDCGMAFAESLADSAEMTTPYEFWGTLGIFREAVLTCPFCGCEELDEVAKDEVSEAPHHGERAGELQPERNALVSRSSGAAYPAEVRVAR